MSVSLKRVSSSGHTSVLFGAGLSCRADMVGEPFEKRLTAMRRNVGVPRFEHFAKVWVRPKARDNPPKYFWLRLKPEPRLTPHRDD